MLSLTHSRLKFPFCISLKRYKTFDVIRNVERKYNLKWFIISNERGIKKTEIDRNINDIKGTVMQIEKALINDRLRVSKVS